MHKSPFFPILVSFSFLPQFSLHPNFISYPSSLSSLVYLPLFLFTLNVPTILSLLSLVLSLSACLCVCVGGCACACPTVSLAVFFPVCPHLLVCLYAPHYFKLS
jgi:hypothetical protein